MNTTPLSRRILRAYAGPARSAFGFRKTPKFSVLRAGLQLESLEARQLLAADISIGRPSEVIDVEQPEFDESVSEFAFLVRLSEPAMQSIDVDYRVLTRNDAGSAATAGDDDFDFSSDPLRQKNGTVSFQPGETVKRIGVLVRGDTVPELAETFAVRLTGTSAGNIIVAEAQGVILNDDLDASDPLGQQMAAKGTNGVADGIIKSFRAIRGQIEEIATNLSELPLIGSQLAEGVQPFLDDLTTIETQLSDGLDAIYSDLDPSGFGTVGDAIIGFLRVNLFTIFGPDGLNILFDGPDPGGTVDKTDIVLTYEQQPSGVATGVQFDFHLGQTTFVDLAFDFGRSVEDLLPFFDFRVDASDGIRFQLGWDVYLGFGYTTEGGGGLGEFYLNTAPQDRLGDEVPEVKLQLEAFAAPPKDAFGNEIITNEPGINADTSLGLMHTHIEDGTSKRVTLTATSNQAISLLGPRDYSNEFDLVVLFTDPNTGTLRSDSFHVDYQSPIGGEKYPQFLLNLQATIDEAIHDSNSSLAAELLPISVRPDLSNINSVENPGQPTTPALSLNARTPIIRGMTIKGDRIHEWGFAPIAQTDDDRSTTLGFETGQSSDAQNVLRGRFAAPDEIANDVDFVLEYGTGASKKVARVQLRGANVEDGMSLAEAVQEAIRDALSQQDVPTAQLNQIQVATIDLPLGSLEAQAMGIDTGLQRIEIRSPRPLKVSYDLKDRTKAEVSFSLDIGDPDDDGRFTTTELVEFFGGAIENKLQEKLAEDSADDDAPSSNDSISNRANGQQQRDQDQEPPFVASDATSVLNDLASLFRPKFDASVALRLNISSDMDAISNAIEQVFGLEGGTLGLPQLMWDLKLDAGISVDPTEEEFNFKKSLKPGLESLKFDNVMLDPRELIGSILEPIANVVGETLGPVTDVLGDGVDAARGFINQPIPLISDLVEGDITILDLHPSGDNVNAFLGNLSGLIKLAGSLSDFLAAYDGRPISFGCFEFDQLSRLVLPCEVTDTLEEASSISSESFLESFASVSAQSGGFKLDILSVESIVNMMVGEPFDIVSFSLPTLDVELGLGFEFGFEDLSVDAFVGADLKVDLGLAYDSSGIERIVDAFQNGTEPDWSDLLDGFYVRNNVGPELELTLKANGEGSIDLSPLFAGEARISLEGGVALDIIDPNEDGRLRFDEVLAVTNNFSNPENILCMFDPSVGGAADFYASITVLGVSLSTDDLPFPTSFSFSLSLQDIFGAIGFDCSNVIQPILATAITEDEQRILRINAGPFAPERIRRDIDDSDGVAVRVWQDTAGGVLKVETKNQDGTLQSSKPLSYRGPFGKIVASGSDGDDVFDFSGVIDPITIEVTGGDGDDTILGGPGANTISGGFGNDTLLGGVGNDLLRGGPGDDRIAGISGVDRILGGEGNDLLASTVLPLTPASDTLLADAGGDYIDGGAGDDVLIGGEQDDQLLGGPGDDSISGGLADDRIFAGSGDDTVNGDEGNDEIHGGQGDDVLRGGNAVISLLGDGDDTIFGGMGQDRLLGGPGNDVLFGNEGNDQLTGNGGRDSLYGDQGSDFIAAGIGDLWADGGIGSDILGYDARETDEDVVATLLSDRIVANGMSTTFVAFENMGAFQFGRGDDKLTVDSPPADASFFMGDGDDSVTIVHTDFVHTLDGDAGSNFLIIQRRGDTSGRQGWLGPQAVSGFGIGGVIHENVGSVQLLLGSGNDLAVLDPRIVTTGTDAFVDTASEMPNLIRLPQEFSIDTLRVGDALQLVGRSDGLGGTQQFVISATDPIHHTITVSPTPTGTSGNHHWFVQRDVPNGDSMSRINPNGIVSISGGPGDDEAQLEASIPIQLVDQAYTNISFYTETVRILNDVVSSTEQWQHSASSPSDRTISVTTGGDTKTIAVVPHIDRAVLQSHGADNDVLQIDDTADSRKQFALEGGLLTVTAGRDVLAMQQPSIGAAAGGGFRLTPTNDFSDLVGARDLAFSTDGRFVYVTAAPEQNVGTIVSYEVRSGNAETDQSQELVFVKRWSMDDLNLGLSRSDASQLRPGKIVQSGNHVFVTLSDETASTNSVGDRIAIFRRDSDTGIEFVGIGAEFAPDSLLSAVVSRAADDPDTDFMYAVVTKDTIASQLGSLDIFGFRVSGNGSTTPLNGGDALYHVEDQAIYAALTTGAAFSSDGTKLYVGVNNRGPASSGNDPFEVLSFQSESDGTLEFSSGDSYRSNRGQEARIVDIITTDDGFLYVADGGDDRNTVYGYQPAMDGRLSDPFTVVELSNLINGTGTSFDLQSYSEMAVDPAGEFLYLTGGTCSDNTETEQQIIVLQKTPSGMLIAPDHDDDSALIVGSGRNHGIAFTPDGTRLFSVGSEGLGCQSNSSSDEFDEFFYGRRDPEATGAMGIVRPAGFETGDQRDETIYHTSSPLELRVRQFDEVVAAPSGRDVFAISAEQDALLHFQRVDGHGELKLVDYFVEGFSTLRGEDRSAHTSVPSGLRGANSLAISSDGRSVYVSSAILGTVAEFRIEDTAADNWALSFVRTVALPGVKKIVVAPNGQSVVAINSQRDRYHFFTRTASGSLTNSQSRSAALAGGSPTNIAVSVEEVVVIASQTSNQLAFGVVGQDASVSQVFTAPDVLAFGPNRQELPMLYVSEAGSGRIHEFSVRNFTVPVVQSRGLLQNIPGIHDIQSLALTDDNQYLLVTSNSGSSAALLHRDATQAGGFSYVQKILSNGALEFRGSRVTMLPVTAATGRVLPEFVIATSPVSGNIAGQLAVFAAHEENIPFTTNEDQDVERVGGTVMLADATSLGEVTTVSSLQWQGLVGVIGDIEVTIDISHSRLADLQATLISPAGTRVRLFENLVGDELRGTVLDDDASISIAAAADPYTGRFRPTDSLGLTQLQNEDPNGVWQLEIVDAVMGGAGILNDWYLNVATSIASATLLPDLTTAFGNALNSDAVLNDGNNTLDTSQDSPDAAAFMTSSVAVARGRTADLGLPNDGFIPAGRGDLPFNVQLWYTNDDDGLNALTLFSPSDTASIDFAAQNYESIYVFATNAGGDGQLNTTLRYSDGTTQSFSTIVDDWFDDGAELNGGNAYLINNLIRGNADGTGGTEPAFGGDPAIFALNLPANSSKALIGIDFARTAAGDNTVIFGVMGMPAGVLIESTIEFPAVADRVVDVNLSLEHSFESFAGLSMVLTSPGGHTVDLISPISFGPLPSGLGPEEWELGPLPTKRVSFDDEVRRSILTAIGQEVELTGGFRPEQLLSDVDGINPAGDWTLSISNLFGVRGTLSRWTLDVTLETPDRYQVEQTAVATTSITSHGTTVDTVTIQDNTSRLQLDTQGGADTVFVARQGAGALSVVLGDGDDQFDLVQPNANSTVSVNGNNGNDLLQIWQADSSGPAGTTLNGGSGSDTYRVVPKRVAADTTVRISGDAADSVLYDPTGGNVTVSAPGIVRIDGRTAVATTGIPIGSITSLVNPPQITGVNRLPSPVSEGNSLVLIASTSTAGTVDWDLNGDGQFEFLGRNVLNIPWNVLRGLGIDDGPANYPITVKLSTTTNEFDFFASSIQVADRLPTFAVTAATIGTESQPFALSIVADDPGADTIQSWRVDWGDGTVESFLSGDLITNHTYVVADRNAQGQLVASKGFTILVEATDDEGNRFSSATTPALRIPITINNTAPLVRRFGGTNVAVEGQPYELNLEAFLDKNFNDQPNFTANATTNESSPPANWIVSWGDGTVETIAHQPAPDGTFSISHVYRDNGKYTPQVLAVESADTAFGRASLIAGTPTFLGSLVVSVANVAPQVTATPITSTVINEGALVQLQLGYADLANVNSVVDEPIEWTVDWGDGTVDVIPHPEIVTANMTVSHRYRDDGHQFLRDASGAFVLDANGQRTIVDNVPYSITMAMRDEDGIYPVVMMPPGAPSASQLDILVNNVNPAIRISGSPVPVPTGAWQLDGDLRNEVDAASPLQPLGFTPSFTSTSIAGVTTTVLQLPRFTSRTQTLTAQNPITGNGTGELTNVWTIAMDVNLSTLSPFVSLLSTDSTNSNDTDIFLRTNGQIDLGSSSVATGAFAANRWMRIVLTQQASGRGDLLTKAYIDGQFVGLARNPVDGSTALREVFHFFSDDNGETVPMLVGSLAYWDVPLTPIQVEQLGPVTAAGINAATEGGIYQLELSSSDPGRDTITQWQIDWGDGSPIEMVPTGRSITRVTHRFADGDATYNVQVTARDEDGSYTAQPYVVHVTDVAPNPSIRIAQSVYNGARRDSLEFSLFERNGDRQFRGSFDVSRGTPMVDRVLEGQVTTIELRADDPGQDRITHWQIDWGDQSPIETIPVDTDYDLGVLLRDGVVLLQGDGNTRLTCDFGERLDLDPVIQDEQIMRLANTGLGLGVSGGRVRFDDLRVVEGTDRQVVLLDADFDSSPGFIETTGSWTVEQGEYVGTISGDGVGITRINQQQLGTLPVFTPVRLSLAAFDRPGQQALEYRIDWQDGTAVQAVDAENINLDVVHVFRSGVPTIPLSITVREAEVRSDGSLGAPTERTVSVLALRARRDTDTRFQEHTGVPAVSHTVMLDPRNLDAHGEYVVDWGDGSSTQFSSPVPNYQYTELQPVSGIQGDSSLTKLTDGNVGSTNLSDGQWVRLNDSNGQQRPDILVDFDFGQTTAITNLALRYLSPTSNGSNVPVRVSFSNDGQSYSTNVAPVTLTSGSTPRTMDIAVPTRNVTLPSGESIAEPIRARYVRLDFSTNRTTSETIYLSEVTFETEGPIRLANGMIEATHVYAIDGQHEITVRPVPVWALSENQWINSAQLPLTISGIGGLVRDVNVTVNVDHPSMGDLQMDLISPVGQRVPLARNVGGPGSNMFNTRFDDEAGNAIYADGAVAPFTGVFRPAELLSQFDGIEANGQWSLEVTDTVSGKLGSISSWAIELTTDTGTHQRTATGPVAIDTSAESVLTVGGMMGQIEDLNVAFSLNRQDAGNERFVETFDFVDPSGGFDAQVWETRTDLRPGASVMRRTGRAELSGGGLLLTTADFPTDDEMTPLTVSGQWTFASVGSDGSSQFRVRTRGEITGGGAPVIEGVLFQATSGPNATLTISSNFNGLTTSFMGSDTIAISQGDTFAFHITDDGQNVTFTLTEVGDPTNTSTVTTTVTMENDVNRVIFEGEGVDGSVSYLDDVSIYYQDQLTVELIHPDGTVVPLVATTQGAAFSYDNTILDDESALQLSQANHAYRGTYQPLGTLSVLDGKSPNGDWRLRVTDNATGVKTLLTRWSLDIDTGIDTIPPVHNETVVVGTEQLMLDVTTTVDFGIPTADAAPAAMVLFDYVDVNNYKFAGVQDHGLQRVWFIGQRDDAGLHRLAEHAEALVQTADHVFEDGNLQLLSATPPADLLPITLSDSGTTVSQVNIATVDSLAISDVQVTLTLTHPDLSRISATLVGPRGESLPLILADTLEGTRIAGARFADASDVAIEAAAAPYQGVFRPAAPNGIAAFIGTDPAGSWSLRVTDSLADGNTGQLLHWSAEVFAHPTGQPASFHVIETTMIAGDGAATSAELQVAVINRAPRIDVLGQKVWQDGVEYSVSLQNLRDPGQPDTVTQYRIDWGDGTALQTRPITQFEPTHTYATPGDYTVRVTLIDEDGTHAGAGRLDVSIVDRQLLGDFDDDSLLGCRDIDALVAEIVRGTNAVRYDVTGDNRVDAADLDYWITSLKGTEPGDADLDFDVDITDLVTWINHQFAAGAGWCGGDFNADGVTDGFDFNIWLAHRDTRGSIPVVNDPGDGNDGNLENGVTTLREAVEAANQLPGRNRITFALPAGSTIQLASELFITEPLVVTGPGAERLSVSGRNATRLFRVDVNGSLEISGLTLENGRTNLDGGAILAEGNLIVDGIRFVANHANRNGGAIYTSGGATVRRSEFVNGSTTELDGAGIYIESGTADIRESTFAGNTAAREGGALKIEAGTVTLVNSTVSGNSAADAGGGIQVAGGELTILHSTITDNTDMAGRLGRGGGGIWLWPGGAPHLYLGNSIVAGNHSEFQSDLSANATMVTSLGNNLVGRGANSGTLSQWGEASGGNGHYYEVVQVPGGIDWNAANAAANAAGGHLVSITSEAESNFVFGLINDQRYWNFVGANIGPWTGAVQPAGSAEPAGGWRWVTGETMSFSRWDNSSAQPDNSGGNESRVHYINTAATPAATWNDTNPLDARSVAYVIEYDAMPYAMSDRVAVDPRLGGLVDNGGPTRTHRLLSGSPAIDAISVAYSQAVLSANPMAYWRMSETQGTTVADSSSSGRTATLVGGTAPGQPAVTANLGYSVQLDGTSGYLDTAGLSLNGLTSFSLSGWFRPLTPQANRTGIFGQNDLAEIGFIDSTTLQFWTPGHGALNVTYDLAAKQGDWVHVAAVATGNQKQIFVNGELAATAPHGQIGATGYGNSAFPVRVGGGGVFDVSGNFFRGEFDEIAVYSSALSPEQVRSQYVSALDTVTQRLRTDQRGIVRPIDGDADGVIGIDIGSVEVTAVIPAPTGDRGDLDGNRIIDVHDADLLVAQIVSREFDGLFDVNADRIVDREDLKIWISEFGRTLPGDANLDGRVDSEDFGIIASHLFGTGDGWSDGDFNADGFVDTADFGIWNAYKFQASSRVPAAAQPARVPRQSLAGRSTMGESVVAEAVLRDHVFAGFEM